MAVIFAPQWLTYGGTNVKFQPTAKTIIDNASAALAGSNIMEVSTWRGAIATGAPGALHNVQGSYLEVYKGEHQAEGVFGQFAHLTMSLWIQRKTLFERHALYKGAFHLYIEIIDPVVGQNKKKLKPVQLNYVDITDNIKAIPIDNAALCDSDG